MGAAPTSTKSTCDVILGLLVPRFGEDHFRVSALDQAALEEERRLIRNARRLLHVVGHDHDRVAVGE